MYLNDRLYKFGTLTLFLIQGISPTSVLHLFSNCSKFKALWSSIQNLFKETIDLPCLSHDLAVVGFLKEQNDGLFAINHIILLFKRFLFIKRSSPYLVNIHAFKLYVQHFEKVEQKHSIRKREA